MPAGDLQRHVPLRAVTGNPVLQSQRCGAVNLPARYPVLLELLAMRIGFDRVTSGERAKRETEVTVNVHCREPDCMLGTNFQRLAQKLLGSGRIAATYSSMTQLQHT